MSCWSCALLGVAALAGLFYAFLVWNFDYWRRRGVSGPKPLPVLGSFPSFFTQKQNFADDLQEIYKKYKGKERVVGVFLIRVPQLLIMDRELIREVFVTSFKNFHDNDVAKLVDPIKDPLAAHNPFILAGKEWREQRALVSPGLTGTRIKVAFNIMREVSRKLCAYVEQEQKLAGSGGLQMSDIAARFTAENVAASVLGIEAQSFTATPLPIAENMRKFLQDNTILIVYTIMSGIFPAIIKLYKAKFIPLECERFFIELMERAFRMRRTQQIERLDFMNHLLAIQEKHQLDDTALASHAMTFLMDGLDTTAVVISHCLLLLARNPDTLDTLRTEIESNLDDNEAGDKPELSFEKLNELPYLDACVHESLRIFPPGTWSTKSCTEAYELTQKNGQKLRIEPNETVIIPIYSVHMDAEYYPEPERFNPDRFMPANGGVKKYRDMGVFLGFGDGPRTCLGMRFALVQVKVAVVALVRQFDIRVNPKTLPSNCLEPASLLGRQKGDVWLDFERREEPL